MSDTLVIEWDRGRLIAAVGTAAAKTVNVASATTVDRQGGNLLPRELGEKLAAELKAAGIVESQAIVVFPRELVTFHRVQLPNLADDELPEMVSLQAATRLTVPVESVCLDFVPLPVIPGSATRDVLLVTVPRTHVNDVREALSVCGIQLAGVRVSSFGIAASAVHSGLLSSATDQNAVEVVVSMRSDSIEMIFMTGHHVAFSHSGSSWTSPDGVEQAVRSEISRARMSAAEDMGAYQVGRLIVIGDPEFTTLVPDSISKRLNDAEVSRIDPATLFEGSLPTQLKASEVLAVIGVIANDKAKTVDTADLVNPRKAAEKKDYSRLKKILAVGTAALAIGGGLSWRASTVNALKNGVATVKLERDDLEQMYKAAEDELRLDSDLQEWSNRDLSWLDEMQKIRTLMGGTDRVLIRKLKFSTRSGKYLGAIDAEGYARSRRDVEDLMQVLAEAGYEVTPKEMPQNMRDPAYPMELRLEVSIPDPSAKNGRS